jgi:hypothetical protein
VWGLFLVEFVDMLHKNLLCSKLKRRCTFSEYADFGDTFRTGLVPLDGDTDYIQGGITAAINYSGFT